jgi:carbamoyltransferase
MSKYHLGINLGHDRSAAIVQDGEIKVAIQQERLDRCKHSIGYLHQSIGDDSKMQLPWEAINYCLEEVGIDIMELESITANMPGIDHAPAILKNSLPSPLADMVQTIPSHHLSHAYSAYWPSGMDEAVILAVDASGSTHSNRTESYSVYEA